MSQSDFSPMVETLCKLPEGLAARVTIEHPYVVLRTLSLEALRIHLDDRLFIGALSLMDRVGVAYFQRYLELTYFRPGTPEEPFLKSFFLRWKGLLWSITSVPREWFDASESVRHGESLLREAIAVARLRVVEGFTPAILGSGGSAIDEASRPVGEKGLFELGAVELDLPFGNLLYLENRRDHLVYSDPSAASIQEADDIRQLEERHGVAGQ
jgi:hypothetical protein